MRLRIRQSVVDDIIRHAREDLPNECCGLLVGRDDELMESVRARNLRPSPTRFLIDPDAHFAVVRRARGAGLKVVGAYHSHPNTSAWPSATDQADLGYPEFLHVIVSLADSTAAPAVRAFRFGGGNFEPVELVLTE